MSHEAHTPRMYARSPFVSVYLEPKSASWGTEWPMYSLDTPKTERSARLCRKPEDTSSHQFAKSYDRRIGAPGLKCMVLAL